MNKRIIGRLLTSCISVQMLATTTIVLAESAYVPPPNQPSPTEPTTSTGSRGGCQATNGKSLTLLAPIKRAGQTASSYPTFAWFVPDDSTFPVEFQLFEYDSDQKTKSIQEILLKSSPGIMKLSLAKDKPGLASGKRYLWQVRIICDANHPSADLVARAEIELVEKSQDLKKALSTAKNHLETAQIYGRNGMWYDALSEALGTPEDSRLKKFAETLLEDLANLEEPEQSKNLRRIINLIYNG